MDWLLFALAMMVIAKKTMKHFITNEMNSENRNVFLSLFQERSIFFVGKWNARLARREGAR